MEDPYVLDPDGIWRPPVPVQHRDEDYDSSGFESLWRMQTRHFWYRGRHRFVLHFSRRVARALGRSAGAPPTAIDLGGGCGGWVRYLDEHANSTFGEIALADSSATALSLAENHVPATSRRYHIDLLNLQWTQRWDVAFLLDVLEHIEQDSTVLPQVREALRPGGYLIITTPALERFRTSVDDMAHHVRRYSIADFGRLARASGLELVTARYFMFLLSPLMWWARRSAPDPAGMTPSQIRAYLDRSDRTPPRLVNLALGAVFAAETPLGAWCRFPWGTSVLAVLRRPHF
jgi:2-polyprenyl-3-methyl-5-hydroxy-6-metoxy-1,4-benzoquinol methylase